MPGDVVDAEDVVVKDWTQRVLAHKVERPRLPAWGAWRAGALVGSGAQAHQCSQERRCISAGRSAGAVTPAQPKRQGLSVSSPTPTQLHPHASCSMLPHRLPSPSPLPHAQGSQRTAPDAHSTRCAQPCSQAPPHWLQHPLLPFATPSLPPPLSLHRAPTHPHAAAPPHSCAHSPTSARVCAP